MSFIAEVPYLYNYNYDFIFNVLSMNGQVQVPKNELVRIQSNGKNGSDFFYSGIRAKESQIQVACAFSSQSYLYNGKVVLSKIPGTLNYIVDEFNQTYDYLFCVDMDFGQATYVSTAVSGKVLVGNNGPNYILPVTFVFESQEF